MIDSEIGKGISVREVLHGLQQPQKRLPSKYFYDERGSQLFEQICELPEYYPTRTELSIMKSNIDEITETLGKEIELVEFGSGSSLKTRLLLDHLQSIQAYYPVDISEKFLLKEVRKLRKEYNDLSINPIPADYTESFNIPYQKRGKRTIVYFPGSTIGNFRPEKAAEFLAEHRQLMQRDGGMLIGVDRKKDKDILERAYNDTQGITAAFNLNILDRLNRELDAGIDVNLFEHRAFYNETEGRIEMHLVSKTDHTIEISGVPVLFRKGETIHTENSYKYSPEEVEELFGDKYRLHKTWSDPDEYFSIYFFEASV